MRRLLLAALLVWLPPTLALPVLGQPTPTETTPATVLPPQALIPRSLADHPMVVNMDIFSDSLSEGQILRRISRLYRYQSDLLMAQVEGDSERAETLLDVAMTELATLLQQPHIMDHPRFRELYRTLVVEHERYYGPSDTLTLPYGDIFPLRADMFALLNDVDEPLLENVNLFKLRPVATTVPLTMNRLVESTISYLLKNPERHLTNWLSRAETYFPMVEQIFAEEGIPDELKYLGMIESGLNPRARSWARAVGMWQFISATGRTYGLQVDAWVDERRDPERATRAAARHLRDLYEQYGDWHIALAGYNCSPRCIQRAIRRAEARTGHRPTYWDMYPYLPRETRNYVPMFIATALIASNPEAFDLKPSRPGPRYAYEYVPVRGALRLSTVADLTGTDVETIRALNPALRRTSLPPSAEPYYLRIPLGTYEQFVEGYEKLPDEAKLPPGEYIVRRGDTLGKIARQYGLSVSRLMRDNDLRSTRLSIGQRLVVPVPRYDSALPSLAEAQKTTVDYGTRRLRPLSASAPLAEAPAPVVRTSMPVRTKTPPAPDTRTDTRVVHRVQRGETLGKIAENYGVSVRDVQGWNNLRGTRIKAGQRLTIYAGTTPESTPKEDETEPQKITYKVRSGDTLSEIAEKYGVSTGKLRQWNGLRGSRIRAGQRLTIYPPEGNVQSHIVRRGDTLDEIARKYGVSIQDLKTWNSLRSSTIHPGQELTVRR